MTYNRHYCYRIDFADGFVYFGVRTCRCQIAADGSYTGSPITHAAKWLTDTPRVKTIVSVHATRQLANEAEAKLISDFWAVSKELSLNASIAGAKFNAQGFKWYTNDGADICISAAGAVPAGFKPGRADASTETRAKLSKAGMNRKHNDETRAKMSKSASSRHVSNKQIAICSHCGTEGISGPGMNRWHFDNCKLVKPRLKAEPTDKQLKYWSRAITRDSTGKFTS